MTVNLLFGNSFYDACVAEWQKKTFSDEKAAFDFIKKHQHKIYGINGKVWYPELHLWDDTIVAGMFK